MDQSTKSNDITAKVDQNDEATTSSSIANPTGLLLLESPQPKKLSKRQQKKEARLARHLEARKEKRVIEKARKKEKRAQLQATGTLKPRAKTKTMAMSACKIRVAIDMAYEDVGFDCINNLEVENFRNESMLTFFVDNLAFKCFLEDGRAPHPKYDFSIEFLLCS